MISHSKSYKAQMGGWQAATKALRTGVHAPNPYKRIDKRREWANAYNRYLKYNQERPIERQKELLVIAKPQPPDPDLEWGIYDDV